MLSFAKQQCGAIGQLVVQQQEVKRDWLEEGEEIRIDFVFCEVKESRTFQASKRRRRPYLPTYSVQIAFPQRHTFCAYIYYLGRGCTFFLHIYNRYLYIKCWFLVVLSLQKFSKKQANLSPSRKRFKKEMACSFFAGPVYWMHLRLRGCRRETTCLVAGR